MVQFTVDKRFVNLNPILSKQKKIITTYEINQSKYEINNFHHVIIEYRSDLYITSPKHILRHIVDLLLQ